MLGGEARRKGCVVGTNGAPVNVVTRACGLT